MGLLKRLMLLVWFLLLDAAELAAGNLVLIGKNLSLSFDAVEANFAPAIKGSGECGILYLAEPLDACTLLQNKVPTSSDSPFVLIVRGGCTFDEKVRRAQEAEFKAAIVYNNEDSGSLVAMSGSPGGIHIHAAFVSKFSGETLKNYVSCTVTELWIIPTFENSAWTILAISFISLLAMSAVLATCFFVRRHQIRHEQPRAPNIREFHGMSRRLVKSMPSLVFTSVLEDNCTSATCAICLEDYSTGEKLRILPCRHKFHAICVDSWLTSWRTFCPVCKQDARTSTGNPPPSERTPLLSSAGSPSISISNSPSISISRSSVDLRNASFRRLHASPHSLGLRSSPINSRYISPYIPSSSNASPSYLSGSSSRPSYSRRCGASGASLSALRHCGESGTSLSALRHCGESGTSLSAMDSMHSLPEC